MGRDLFVALLVPFSAFSLIFLSTSARAPPTHAMILLLLLSLLRPGSIRLTLNNFYTYVEKQVVECFPRRERAALFRYHLTLSHSQCAVRIFRLVAQRRQHMHSEPLCTNKCELRTTSRKSPPAASSAQALLVDVVAKVQSNECLLCLIHVWHNRSLGLIQIPMRYSSFELSSATSAVNHQSLQPHNNSEKEGTVAV